MRPPLKLAEPGRMGLRIDCLRGESMPPKVMLPVLAAGLFWLTGCDFEDFNIGHFNRDFHYSYPMSPAGKLSVETFNGSIEVSGWDRDTVDISGTKYGPTQQAADELQVSVD